MKKAERSADVHVRFGGLARWLRTWTSVLLSLTCGAFAQGQKPTPPAPFQPDHRQIWVPRDQLDAVLAQFPRAIFLNRDEYEALVRDAGKTAVEPDAAPPAAAVIERATFVGEVLENIVRVRATYEVDCLIDEWAEIPLAFDPGTIASIEVDETSALRSIPAGKGTPKPALVVRGKGKHTVVAEFHVGIVRNATGQRIEIPNPRLAAANFTLTFPQKVEIVSAFGFSAAAAGKSAEFEFPPDDSPLGITWTSRDITSLDGSAIQQICRFNYHLKATVIEADLGLRLTSELADLPEKLVFALPPDAEVRNVVGTAVQAWTVDEATQQLLIDRFPHRRHQLDVRILLDTPSLADDETELRTALPMLQAEGVFRAEGRLAVLMGENVRVQEISTGPLLTSSLLQVEPELAARPDFVAAFSFPAISEALEVTFRRTESEVHGGLDTHVAIQRDGIHLTRTLVVQPREGSVFETRLTLPDTEEIVSVNSSTNQLVDWDQDEQLLTLTWRPPPGNETQSAGSGLDPGVTGTAEIKTRIDPDDWYNLETGAFPFANAETDLDVVYGYVAVDADPAFTIETGATEGLENRDGRATPITGQLAWERLGPYSLELNVTRREPAIFGQMTAYALPLTNSLEVEGQLFLTVRNSPVRSVEISLPVDVAPLFKADSPLISEQQLDEETGIWTLRFHREFEGVIPIRWQMSIPFDLVDDGSEKRFTIEVPAIGMPGANRLFGHWMLEANTDTELSFSAEGLDAVDSLRIPTIAGYLPQHRVIAAYGYRGGDYALTIEGVRHSAENIVTTIIDDLAIDSVVSTGGVDRHQVQIVVRSAGDQFLEVGLPVGSRLWSLLVDGQPVKPVQGSAQPGLLRIHLPAHVDSKKPAHIRLIFESDAVAWRDSGRRTLPTIELNEGIPILRSTWQLHLPEGFSYRDFDSNLKPSFEEQPKVLLSYVWDHWSGQQLLAEEARMDQDRMQANEIRFVQAWEQQTSRSERQEDPRTAYVREKLTRIIVPAIEFDDTPLSQAIEFLRTKSIELDEMEPDPARRGIGIIIRQGIDLAQTPAPRQMGGNDLGFDDPAGGSGFDLGSGGDPSISLKLTNVPLIEALRYTTDLARLSYKIEPHGIVITPLGEVSADFYTQVFLMPPAFLLPRTSSPSDPFANLDATQSPNAAPASPREALEMQGI
ncbi:MAG: hypothetical protein ACI8UO_003100, partial [Verrucomicrobiales bacterium]